MTRDLETAFASVWNTDTPFVLYRLPKEKEVVLLQQNTPRLYPLDSATQGFVIAPFEASQTALRIHADVTQTFKAPETRELPSNVPLPPEAEKAAFLAMLEAVKAPLQAQHLEKVVLSRKITVDHQQQTPIALYIKLLTYFPNALVYCWHHPKQGTWLGASPEQLLQQQNDSFSTMALAGTLPMSETPQWTSKERYEQQLVVDRIVEVLQQQFPNEQVVLSPTYTKQAGNLVHLNTDISFNAPSDSLFKIAAALHPTPAVGGVPISAALKAIRAYEKYDRSFYSGYLGPVLATTAQLFVNLRCMQWTGTAAQLYVGGGITAQSDAEAEWVETQRKAAVLYNLLQGNL